MSKFLLLLILFIGTNCAVSALQPFYDLKKDKHWLDSLRSVLKKSEEGGSSVSLKKYFDVNLVIGDYYEKMYHYKKLPHMKKAIKYYTNITSIPSFTEGVGYLKLMAIRNNLCRKLSNIYFFGKGIKQDHKEALALALKGMGNNKVLFKKYSKRFFNCECFVLSKTKINDSLFVLQINPFYYRVARIVDLDQREMSDVADHFYLYHKSMQGYLYITGYPNPSMADQSRTQRVINNVKSYFVYNASIPDKNIIAYEELNFDKSNTIIEISYSMQKNM